VGVRLSTRISLSLLAPIVLCMTVFGVANVRLRRGEMIEDARRELRDHGTSLSVALGAALRDHQIGDVAELAEDLTRADRVLGVIIFDEQDRPLRASRTLQSEVARYSDVARRARLGRARVSSMGTASGHQVLAYGFVIEGERGQTPQGAAVVLRDLSYIDDNLRSSARSVALVGLVLVLTVMLAAWLGVRAAVLRPLALLVSAVESAGLDALDRKAAVLRRDEIGTLAQAYNALLDSLSTARQTLEERSDALVALERRLHHAQRLAMVGQLAANLAHKVGSPLNVILGRARYALQQGGQSERDARHLREILAGAESISSVIEQLLQHARKGRGRVGPVELGAVARDVARFLEVDAEEKQVSLTVDASAPVVVHGARDEIEQVLLNLCVNAMQAQPNGGAVRMRARAVSGSPPRAEFTVDDAGPGIAAADRLRVFEPFYTTKPPDAGTGLGLTICEEVVRRLGGTITVTASELGGACFVVSLPLEDRMDEREVGA
jgi:signal transduction histidine kinase